MHFDNRFRRELAGDPLTDISPRPVRGAAWSNVMPTPVSSPQLIAYSLEMANELGLTATQLAQGEWLAALSGNGAIDGMEPIATCYGGHQFGHWAGQLGDGRAISLGEALVNNKRWELQLKGAGPTPYSRRADGRAVLRSSIREFLCSEAMHHLGVPTTRALSLVLTGDSVVRDMFYDGRPENEPGAIVCRVSPSFIRFGHFEIFAARDDKENLNRLIDFTIARDYPHLDPQRADVRAQWFREVCERTARLVAEWMRVGFVHGVMNTDNMSILGLTIDYGPYGWVDNLDPGWTPNTTDAQGKRYAFGRQAEIARWNVERLADALAMVMDDTAPLVEGISSFDRTYASTATAHFAAKFGLLDWQDSDGEWVNEIFALMQRAEVDMSLFFRSLGMLNLVQPSVDVLQPAFYREESWHKERDALAAWVDRYTARCRADAAPQDARSDRMRRANPLFVLRNYLAQEVIDRAHEGDFAPISELLDVMRRPYDEQPGRERYAAKRPEWARNKPGSSMLSCSS